MNIFLYFKRFFTKEDLTTNDKLGVYPEKTHVPAFLERRYLKTSRVMVIITIISMSVNIMLGSYLFMAPSMISSIPVAFSENPVFGGFRELEKMYVRKPASDIIFEEQIREYIYLRNRIVPDIDVMKRAWQPGSKFYWMSGKRNYGFFIDTEQKQIVEKIKTNGFRQDVYFRWVKNLKPGRWVAEFDTYEYYGWQTKKGTRKRWRAYIVAFINKKIPYGSTEYALRNPLNISIAHYQISSISIKDEK